jgi:hypothetical protein
MWKRTLVLLTGIHADVINSLRARFLKECATLEAKHAAELAQLKKTSDEEIYRLQSSRRRLKKGFKI